MSITEVDVQAPPEVSAGHIRVLESEVAAQVAALDKAVGALPGPEAASLCGLFARIERMAAAAKTLAAGRVVETGAYRGAGFARPHQWLASITREDGGAAGRIIATAGLLGDAALATTRRASTTMTRTAP